MESLRDRRPKPELWLALALALMVTSLPGLARAQTCAVSMLRTLVTTSINSPTDIRAIGGKLFIVEQAGRVRIFDQGSLLGTSFLDITNKVASGGERGLLSLAFHPSYPALPYFFVLYTNGDSSLGPIGDVVLARYGVSGNPNIADPTSAKVLLVVPHSAGSNHNGGQLQFGPNDGYLYLSTGDGGGGCDSTGLGCNAQRDDLLLGKLLRINVNSETPPYYTIPPTNPFVGPGGPRDEIWAKGLRNPWRFSFDRQTGNLWIGDVGQSTREEIDFQPASSQGGQNYGWPIMEGTVGGTCSTGTCPAPVPWCNAPTLTLPVHEYGRSVGSVVIGGFVYRGNQFPALRGCYVFADSGSGKIWAMNSTPPVTVHVLMSDAFGITTFGEDPVGELYMMAVGDVYRLLPTTPVPVPVSRGWMIPLLGMCLLLAGAALVAKRSSVALDDVTRALRRPISSARATTLRRR